MQELDPEDEDHVELTGMNDANATQRRELEGNKVSYNIKQPRETSD